MMHAMFWMRAWWTPFKCRYSGLLPSYVSLATRFHTLRFSTYCTFVFVSAIYIVWLNEECFSCIVIERQLGSSWKPRKPACHEYRQLTLVWCQRRPAQCLCQSRVNTVGGAQLKRVRQAQWLWDSCSCIRQIPTGSSPNRDILKWTGPI